MSGSYTTKDYNEISLLLANKLHFVSVRRHGAVFFSFEPKEKAIELTEAFWRGDLKMILRDFINFRRLAKDLIIRAERSDGRDENRWSNGNGISRENRSF